MLYLKALHIIFVITWFAGLFYIVRLFVYHAEANEKPEPERSILIEHFKGAERRLWYGITWPSAIGTAIFGIWLWHDMFAFMTPGWMLLKLGFVVFLFIYHFMCGHILKLFQAGNIRYSGMKMRMWNEVATLFLVAIVFIVVLKDMLSWIPGLIGLIIFSLAIVAGIRVYKKIREGKKN